MGKRKLAQAIGVSIIAVSMVVGITALPACPRAPTRPTLVTYNCADQRATSLRGQGEVTNIGAGPLSRRGFVWLEGDSGDPVFNITAIPIVNPSFEEGAPPAGWNAAGAILSRETTITKVGNASLKIVSNGTWARAQQDITNFADYAGKRVTLGVWVYCPSTNNVEQRITIGDGVGISYSIVPPRDDTWRFITLSHIVAASPTMLQIRLHASSAISDTDDVLYVDGVFAFLGDAVFEDGEFGAGNHSLTIDSLKPNTSYRVRAFGENSEGIGYGNTVTCRTLAG